MQYRKDKYGNDLSVLGYGCMRFPQKVGRIDMAETEKQLLHAISLGVNYFDTAYIYPGSESALGEILQKNGLREKVCIATKLPHYLIKSKEGLEKLFQEQLRRLRTDYVDYYLMHMLTDTAAWQRMTELGVQEWLEEKKAAGQIRQVGFSYHGGSQMFCDLVDAYPWEFCQIQYNYMDEHSQAGRRGLNYASEKGIPVVIMEPLRGGKLARNLPKTATELFASHPCKDSPAAWAFRWLWDQKEVSVVLSGMNSMETIEENVRTAVQTEAGSMTEEEQALLVRVAQALRANIKVGCTGCGYCQPCPVHVDIPETFASYNRKYQEGWFPAMKEHFMCTALRKIPTGASNCISCGKCESHCPQGIAIREELKKAKKELEGPVYHIARFFARLFVTF